LSNFPLWLILFIISIPLLIIGFTFSPYSQFYIENTFWSSAIVAGIGFGLFMGGLILRIVK